MAKLGIEVRIDVTKIPRDRIYVGEKGKYVTMTTFIDTDSKDEYDNNGFISIKQTKEEREQKINTPILGNCKVFYKEGQQSGGQQNQQYTPPAGNDFEDDIPF